MTSNRTLRNILREKRLIIGFSAKNTHTQTFNFCASEAYFLKLNFAPHVSFRNKSSASILFYAKLISSQIRIL
jgi:hypothetical protein